MGSVIPFRKECCKTAEMTKVIKASVVGGDCTIVCPCTEDGVTDALQSVYEEFLGPCKYGDMLISIEDMPRSEFESLPLVTEGCHGA